MGKTQSKLSPEQLQELSKCTYFDKKELQQWYKSFHKEAPNGILTKGDILGLYRQFFPFGDATRFAEAFYRVLERPMRALGSLGNVNGSTAGSVSLNVTGIDFKSFITALSVMARGKLDEKVAWAFTFYDSDEDGRISRHDMFQAVDAIYRLVGSLTPLPEDEETPQKRVDKLFQIMDKDRDGFLSLDEFKEGSQMDPSIVQALSLYEGLV